ncbi:MAG TPA: hypothetical protein PLW44_17725, partial [Chitinophagales bacterium]|nr:hypothetical protein [Chitinophagales bacterium]
VGDVTDMCTGQSLGTKNAQLLMRPAAEPKSILNVQDLNETESYVASPFTMEILTTPEILLDTTVAAMMENQLPVPNYGTLSISCTDKYSAAVFRELNNTQQLVDRFDITNRVDNHKYQPGEYMLVYKPKTSYDSESTRTQRFKVEEGRMVVVTLE